MQEKKKHFFVLAVIIVVFFILVLITAYNKQKRLAVLKPAAPVVSEEEDSLLERLGAREGFFDKVVEAALEGEDAVEEQAKSILEKLQRRKEEAAQEEPLSCRVFRAKRVRYEDTLPVTGDIKSRKEIKMRFEKEGVIEKLEVKEGDIVKKGEIIAVLNKKDALLAVARARSKVDSDKASLYAAEKELELTSILYNKGAIVETKLEEVRFRVESERSKVRLAEEEFKMAEAALEKMELRAPIDGIIGAKEAEAGEFFTPRDIVVNLLGIGEFYAEVGIVERDIHRINKGQKALARVDAYPNKEFAGEVNNVYPVVEGRSRIMKAEVNIKDEEEILLPGMFAQVGIFLAKFDSAIMIPTMSLLQIAPDTIVVPKVILDENSDFDAVKKGEGLGTINMAEVETGYDGPDYTQITAGLKEGDILVLECHGDIADGRKVRILGVEEYGVNE